MSLNGLPLALAAEGDRVAITDLAGGPAARARLDKLGLSVGTALRIIRKDANGAIVVAIGRSRLALGLAAARQVLVAPIAPPGDIA